MRSSLPGTRIDPKNNRPVQTSFTERAKADDEEELLLKKTFICPVCKELVSAAAIKNGKAVMERMESDLYIRYKNIDPIKYRVIGCASCGYAAMDADFTELSKKELSSIKNASAGISPVRTAKELVRSYEEAFRLYRAALSYSLVKGGKSSERGSIALHTAWLIRTLRLKDSSELFLESDISFKKLCTEENEGKYLRYALQYLEMAGKSESYPIRGMDAATFDYLLASLCYKNGRKKEAYSYTIRALHNQSAGNKIRTMAEDLQELIKKS